MILYIDTTVNDLITIGLKDKRKFIIKKKFKSKRTQAEKLLPAIDKLLKDRGVKLSGLESIEIVNQGGSFTSLRIGVVTANALAYALGIPVIGERGRAKKLKSGKMNFTLVEPQYGGQPNITVKKEKIG